jgi:hypothetical protein
MIRSNTEDISVNTPNLKVTTKLFTLRACVKINSAFSAISHLRYCQIREDIFRRPLIVFILLATLAWPGKALAGSPDSNPIADPANGPTYKGLFDHFVFGDTYTLHSGDTLKGDLVIFGGSVTLEEDSRVTGSVVLIGGNLTIDGEIDGDLVVIGGSPTIGQTGRVRGDATTIGGHLGGDLDRISGSIHTETSGLFKIQTLEGQLPALTITHVPTVWGVLGLLFSVFLMSALAIGVMMFLPKPTERTAQVLTSQPVVSGGMGCLTILVAPFVLLAFAITIVLSPISLLGILVLVALTVFGWIAMGLEIGKRTAQVLNQDWHPAVAAGVGTFALTLVALGLSRTVACVGWMVPFLVSLVALGAVMLTFIGSGRTVTPAMVILPAQPAGTSSPAVSEFPVQDEHPIPLAPSSPGTSGELPPGS